MHITPAQTFTHTRSTHMQTHLHACMYFNIRLTGVQQDDIENGHSKEKWTTNRTALSAVIAGGSVLSGQDTWAFGWVGLACQTIPCHWRQVN